MSLFLVMLGGAIGSGARFLFGRVVTMPAGSGPAGSGFSYATLGATLGVNLLGGVLMGVLAGLVARGGVGENGRLFLGVGVLGGFTTFSAFSLDAVQLAERGAWAAVAAYVLVSVLGSIAALVAGLAAARALA